MHSVPKSAASQCYAIALGVRVAGFDLGRGQREILGFDFIDKGGLSARRMAYLRLGRRDEPTAWNSAD